MPLPSAPPPPSAPDVSMQPGFLVAILVTLFLSGTTIGFHLWKWGRAPPQSVRYLISLIGRRIVMPCIDVFLDFSSMISYFVVAGEVVQGFSIMAVLIVGTLAMTCLTMWAAQREFTYLKTPGRPIDTLGWAALAGLFQYSPLFLGRRAIRAWREVTNHPKYRSTPEDHVTTQEALEEFVVLVADFKQCMQFESLWEGGPQIVIQIYLLVSFGWGDFPGDPKGLGEELMTPTLSSWFRLFSPCFSAFSLMLSQLDFLCENDRFIHEEFKRDAAPVMGLVLLDITSQLAMRVVPLVVLLDRSPIAGGIMLGAATGWAGYSAAIAAHDADQTCCEIIFLNALLFLPTPFFSAFTYHAGHDKEDRNIDGQTTERAFLSRNGFRHGMAHAAWSIVCLAMIAVVDEGKRTLQDERAVFGYSFAVAGLAGMCIARAGLYYVYRTKPNLFGQDAKPELIPKHRSSGPDPDRVTESASAEAERESRFSKWLPSTMKGKGAKHRVSKAVELVVNHEDPAVPPPPADSWRQSSGSASSGRVSNNTRVSNLGGKSRTPSAATQPQADSAGDATKEHTLPPVIVEEDVEQPASPVEKPCATPGTSGTSVSTLSSQPPANPAASSTADGGSQDAAPPRRDPKAWKKWAKPKDGNAAKPAAPSKPKPDPSAAAARGTAPDKKGADASLDNLPSLKHDAALKAWPSMPDNLPLSLALQADSQDDLRTRVGKEKAKDAVARVEKLAYERV